MRLKPQITHQMLRSYKDSSDRIEIADGGCPGLRIRLRGGKGVWSVMVQDADGARRRIEVGDWPDVGIPQARELAQELKKAAKRELAPTAPLTLSDVISLYAQGDAGKGKRWKETESLIRRVLSPILDKRAGALTPPDIQRLIDIYPSRGTAARVARSVRPLVVWAEKRRLIPKGTAVDLETPPGRVRRRVLNEAELGALLNALGRTGKDGIARMLLLTGCRLSEVIHMRFEDIVEDVWIIPAEMRKGEEGETEELRVPLTWLAQQLIGAQGRTSGNVFLNQYGRPYSGRCGWGVWQKKIFMKTGTRDWHRHDLRRTVATCLGEAGVAPHIVEIVLGHKNPHTPLAGVYNKSRYLAEHKEALNLLTDIMCGIELRYRRSVA